MDFKYEDDDLLEIEYERKVRAWADSIRYENTVHSAIEMVKSMEEGNFPVEIIEWLFIKTFPELNIKEIFELAGVPEG